MAAGTLDTQSQTCDITINSCTCAHTSMFSLSHTHDASLNTYVHILQVHAQCVVLALSKRAQEPQHVISVRQTPTHPWEASLSQPAPVTRALRDPTDPLVCCAPWASTKQVWGMRYVTSACRARTWMRPARMLRETVRIALPIPATTLQQARLNLIANATLAHRVLTADPIAGCAPWASTNQR